MEGQGNNLWMDKVCLNSDLAIENMLIPDIVLDIPCMEIYSL